MPVFKSYEKSADPIKDYCLTHSTPLHPVQRKLQEETLKLPQAFEMHCFVKLKKKSKMFSSGNWVDFSGNGVDLQLLVGKRGRLFEKPGMHFGKRDRHSGTG